jgi:SAM-dependent MidA family methyltransferase
VSLKAKLARQIAATGPITVAAFMTACLHDPEFGYYATRPALGAEGDLITAPMVSQMFGELIGLWAAQLWLNMGGPAPFRLVEMGPGDGTLMSDLLRVGRTVPGFLEAGDIWLVETSAPLRGRQAERLFSAHVSWAERLEDVPFGAPLILIANELLDCLPARQFVRTEKGWAERLIGLDTTGALSFGLSPLPEAAIPPRLKASPIGAVVETAPAQERLGRAVGERIGADGGAALFIDYGRAAPEVGDTLQALSRHLKVDPLETAGEADLTVHADFPAFAAAARTTGVEVTSIVTQGEFLKTLGIETRAEALSRAQPSQAAVIEGQLHRLIDEAQMGALFKVVAIHSPGLSPSGF